MDILNQAHEFNQTSCIPLSLSFPSFNSEYLLKTSEIETNVSGAFEPFAQATCDILASSLLCNTNSAAYINQLIQDESTLRQQLNSSFFDGYLKTEDQTTSHIFAKGDALSHLFSDTKSEFEDQASYLQQLWPHASKLPSINEQSDFSFPDSASRSYTSFSSSVSPSAYTSRANSIEQISSFYQAFVNPTATHFGSSFSTPEGRRSLYLDLLQQIKRVQPVWAAHEKSFNYHFYAFLKCQQVQDFAKYDIIFEQLLLHKDIAQTNLQVPTQPSTIINPTLQSITSNDVGMPICNPAGCLPVYIRAIEQLDMLRLYNEPKFKPLSSKDLLENISPDMCSVTNFDQTSFLNAKLCESDNQKQQMPKKGMYRWQDGATYEGEFKNNCMHGYGVYRFLDVSAYEGQWKDNNMHGYGRLTTGHGYYYEGQFYQNKQHGTGTYGEPSGLKYVGTWKQGQLDGRATRVSSTNAVQYGEWEQGKFIKWTSAKSGKKTDKQNTKISSKINTATAKTPKEVVSSSDVGSKSIAFQSAEGAATLYANTKNAQTNVPRDYENMTMETAENSKQRPKTLLLKAWINEAKRLPRHPQVNFNKVLGRWYAIVKNPKTNKRTWKGFSCSIYGFKKARQMAIDYVKNDKNKNFNALMDDAKKKNDDGAPKLNMNSITQQICSSSIVPGSNKALNVIEKGLSEKAQIRNNIVNIKSVPVIFVTDVEQSKGYSTNLVEHASMKGKTSRNIKKHAKNADMPTSAAVAQQKNRQSLMELLADENCAYELGIVKQVSQKSSVAIKGDNCAQNHNIRLFSSVVSDNKDWNKTLKDLSKTEYERNDENFKAGKSYNNNDVTDRCENDGKYPSNREGINLWNNKLNHEKDTVERSSDHNVPNVTTQDSTFCWNGNGNYNCTTSLQSSSCKTNISSNISSASQEKQLLNDKSLPNYAISLPLTEKVNQRDCYMKQEAVTFPSILQNTYATITPQNSLSVLQQLQQNKLEENNNISHCEKIIKKKKRTFSEGFGAWLRQDHWGKGWRCVWIDKNGTQRSKFFGENKWGKDGCRQKAECYMLLATQTRHQLNC